MNSVFEWGLCTRMNCTGYQWLNATTCANCSACSPPLVVARPCGRLFDATCRACMPGFAPVNGTCVLQDAPDDMRNLCIFLLVVLECLVCACAWRWWARLKSGYSRLGI